MMMPKESNLNPLASTFIPSNLTGAASDTEVQNSETEALAIKSAISMKSVALDFTQKVIKYKQERGENYITKRELMNLVFRLLSFRYPIKSKRDIMRIVDYLSNKIPNVLPLMIKETGETSDSRNVNPRIFDFSACRIPTPTLLLVAFYGLYRHEQAFRPLLSLTHRPKVLQDGVWSLTDEDLKLWNRSVAQSCNCPPMFGYHIPVDFFGNPFNFSNSCSIKEIHLCPSKESEEGNEFIIHERVQYDEIAEVEFMDFEEKLVVDPRSDLDYYSKQMKEIVNSVFSLIDDFDTIEDATEDVIDEGYGSTYLESLWNTNISDFNADRSAQLHEDDHPLLNLDFDTEEQVEEVSTEIKELLRKRFSSESDIKVAPSSCNPPCSVWCSKLERSISNQNRRKSDSAIGLLNETSKFLADISSGYETIRPTMHIKPSFKRSFSANDCDCHKYVRPVSSRRRDDSGIMSSQEDVFCEEESGEGSSNKAPMWTLFSGEHSLWKPLPVSEQSKTAQKRARDFKRQTSSLN